MNSRKKFEWRREIKRYKRDIDNDFHLSGRFSMKLDEWLISDEEKKKLADWLKEQPTLLLAHADDGVIWGKVANSELITSQNILPALSPELRAATLQQCRLFNHCGEWLIWRDGSVFHARLVLDKEVKQDVVGIEAFDETQMLWGTYHDNTLSHEGFTVVYEGQGLRHAVPVEASEGCFGTEIDEHKRFRPLRLTVRHYVEEDANGFARVTLSRLVKLWIDCWRK